MKNCKHCPEKGVKCDKGWIISRKSDCDENLGCENYDFKK